MTLGTGTEDDIGYRDKLEDDLGGVVGGMTVVEDIGG